MFSFHHMFSLFESIFPFICPLILAPIRPSEPSRFVLATLQQIDASGDAAVKCMVICHTRELAYQIKNEYDRFSKYFPDIKTAVPPKHLGKLRV